MSLKSLFSTKHINEFAHELADSLAKRYPPVLDVTPEKKISANRLTKVLEETLARAFEVWTYQGVPEHYSALLMTAAKNRALDVFLAPREGLEAGEPQVLGDAPGGRYAHALPGCGLIAGRSSHSKSSPRARIQSATARPVARFQGRSSAGL